MRFSNSSRVISYDRFHIVSTTSVLILCHKNSFSVMIPFSISNLATASAAAKLETRSSSKVACVLSFQPWSLRCVPPLYSGGNRLATRSARTRDKVTFKVPTMTHTPISLRNPDTDGRAASANYVCKLLGISSAHPKYAGKNPPSRR